MFIHQLLKDKLEEYHSLPLVKNKIGLYFEKNQAAKCYVELCAENNWYLNLDHLTVRTFHVDEAAKQYETLGWKYEETLKYPSEGWWAKVYRKTEGFPALFIDQSYENAKDGIIKKWVAKFGDQEFHHIAVRIPPEVEIEEVIELMKTKNISFPGKITGSKGSQLRQIFSQAEIVDGIPFSVLELVQRSKDPITGKIYEGFISNQADSLMKDSIL